MDRVEERLRIRMCTATVAGYDASSCAALRWANLIHKMLQDPNIKLSSVVNGILGKSGRDMLAALVASQDDPVAMAELARGKLRKQLRC